MSTRGGRGDPAARVSVVIADDTPAVLACLQDLLDGEVDFNLVGTARDTPGVIAAVRIHRPDVVVLDVQMPGGGGEVAAAAVRALIPEGLIVAHSAETDSAVIRAMLAAGADRYVAKSGDLDELLRAMRTARDM